MMYMKLLNTMNYLITKNSLMKDTIKQIQYGSTQNTNAFKVTIHLLNQQQQKKKD